MFPSNNKLANELSTKYPVIPNNPQDQIDTLNTKLDAHRAETMQKFEEIEENKVDKDEVDGLVTSKVDKEGDSMSGTLAMSSESGITFGNKFKIAYNSTLTTLDIEVI